MCELTKTLTAILHTHVSLTGSVLFLKSVIREPDTATLGMRPDSNQYTVKTSWPL